MHRAITGFRQDAAADWVAELSCGHGQHARHEPPFTLRPWVVSEEGRASKLGVLLECVRCDRFEIPDDFVASRQTPDFSETTIPAGLLRDHTTKAGTWGRIVVREGALRYVIPSLGRVEVVTPEAAGIVVPELPHHVEPIGTVRFHVELLRAPEP